MKNRIILYTILVLTIPIVLAAQVYWPEHIIDSTFTGASSVFAIDLDEDGDQDVLGAAGYTTDDIAWWENDGASPPNFTKHIVDNNFDGAFSVFAIDIEPDGDIDIIGAASSADEIAWWENNGDEQFTKHVVDDQCDGVRRAYGIDLDKDDDIDIIGAITTAGELAWWENDGSSPPNFTKHHIADEGSIVSVYSIDLDKDTDNDIVSVATGIVDDFTWWENDGASPPNFIEHIINDNINGVCWAYGIDIDGDTDIDLVSCAYNTGDFTWWENDGSTLPNFIEHPIGNLIQPTCVHACDLDNDTDIDILGASYGNDDIVWWENDGNEVFTEHTIGTIVLDAYSVYAADLDNDTDVDVLGASFATGSIKDIAWWEAGLDAGLIDIGIPSLIPTHTPVNPQVTVKNLGTFAAQNLNVTCTIDPSEYSSTEVVSYLAIDESIQVVFPDTFTFATGTYTVTVYTQLIGDQNPTNDTLEKVVETFNVYDVSTISIDIPSVVPEDTTLNPHATVTNFGIHTETFNVVCTIEPGGYTSTTVSNVEPNDSIQVTFPDEFRFMEGTYTVMVYTQLAGDEDSDNDTLEKVIETQDPGVTVDVGTISIDIPDTVSVGSILNPHATLMNFGLNPETFSVICEIEPGSYTSSTVSSLAPSESIQVTFPDGFQFTEIGSYTVTIYTRLVGDQNPTNDTLEKVIEAHDPGIADGGSVPILFSFGLQNNPSKGRALFNLALPEAANIALRIYDVTGRLVDTISEKLGAGYHEIQWTSNVTAGVYFYKFESSYRNEAGKLVLVR
jgi:hypothetical protein